MWLLGRLYWKLSWKERKIRNNKVTKEKKFYYPKVKKSEAKLFKNAILVDPEAGKEIKGDLLVVGGVIEEIGKISSEKAKGAKVIDCNGKHLAPAIVEIQCHIGEPGGEYKENMLQTTKSAIAGGVATVNIMPDMEPVIDTTTIVEFLKNRAKKKAYCNVTLFGSITKNLEGKELSEIGLLKKAGVKAVSDATASIVDSLIFSRACEYAANFDVKIVQQPQDKYLAEGGVINEGEIATRLGVQGIPSISEQIGLQRDIAVANMTKVEYHALNISSASAVEILKREKASNKKLTASTTPHHIALTEEKALNFRTFAKTQPPLRTDDDRKALIEGLRTGVIDFISCNNCPRSEDQKRLPLSSAEFGVVGLETMFSASYKVLSESGFGVPEIIRLLSTLPAEFLGLKNKGKLSKGSVADLFLFDINESWEVLPSEFAGKAVNSPFDGETLKGKVLKTYLAGELVYEEV